SPRSAPTERKVKLLPRSFTSPRLRGEVRICALFAQIPGEGASPRVCACGKSAPLTPTLSPQERGEGAESSRTPYVSAYGGGPWGRPVGRSPRQCGRTQGPPLRNALLSNLMTHMT